ncbi:hypothetical protein KC332_g3420 [Hortaea werneckii]|uniref:Uncharacterized protein n=1 Tax=Hortaea werneckii EXF-2000 TaxID=1157616 RepID=A0A1Z5TNE6_HORWE|nr:hypothetical protein KC350_g2866 [Hortaea werneckii]OTA37536.1 hypothetical protein BTJ68_02776 [Hortaea werneckii EXF-2000]KAI6850754.1 hypothetical protein KC358_g538 [Hortaea werneckii]KAI6942725.1 hypothetical protein KC341_g2037 [Hortaea werneckii]KAI6946082.1 hypothetical protein KC348_g3371 [Hortaea werneckii]
MDWMEEYEYLIWHRWQRMIACRHLSIIDRRRMLIELIQRENRFASSKRIDRLADRMLGMEEDLGADEWGHVVHEETSTTTTTASAQQQQQQQRRQLEEERMTVRRVNAANGLVDAAKESGNQDVANLRRTQEMILAGQMDDLVIGQEEEQKSSRVSRHRKAVMPASPGPSTPASAMTAPSTPGPSTPRRLQARLNAGGHSYSSQSLQQSLEVPIRQTGQAPMPQPQYQPQPPSPAPITPRPGAQSRMYSYNQQQFQQSVQNPLPAPFPANQNYQQGVQQYDHPIQQQQQQQQRQSQQQLPPAEKPKRPKDRDIRSSKSHRHYTQTVTTTTVTTSNTASGDADEEDDQSQYPESQQGQQPYGQQPYGQQSYGQHQSAPPPQRDYNQPRQITQSGDLTPGDFSGRGTNLSVPLANASFDPGYPIPNPAGLAQSNDFDHAKKKEDKKKKKKSKTAVPAGSTQVAGQKGQGEKQKKKKKKYDEL